mmetsp:Transcript_18956/g.34325  ORF Transcript_18956/g.34325 Transcript_18956/m.34325 type:complete len:125 (-) Transcript_18956:1345-1719(-)
MTKTNKDSPKKLVRNQQNRPPKPAKQAAAPAPKKKPEPKPVAEPKAAAPKKKKQKPEVEDELNLKKPGQKRPEPSLDDPTRAFYESLYEQNPQSLMAKKYCLEHGLMDEDVALKVLAEFKRFKA